MTSPPDVLRVSYSSATRFRSCPRAWQFSAIEKLGPLESDPSLIDRDAGTWWHALRAADSIERGRDLGSLKFAPEQIQTPAGNISTDGISPETILQSCQRWEETSLTADRKEVWIDRFQFGFTAHLLSLDARYRARWDDERANERPLAVELPFTRRLSDEVELVGFVDEVFFDESKNLTVARDLKTHRTLKDRYAENDLMDSQNHLYAWAIAHTIAKWGYTLNATGYDRVRMNPPKQPQLTKTGTLAKSVTDFDASTYEAFVGEGISWGDEGDFFKTGARAGEAKFGIYRLESKVLENLRTPDALSQWHQRTLAPLNRNVIRAHVHSLTSTADRMLTTRTALEAGEAEAPRNLTRLGCSWCDFQKLCRAMIFGGPDGDYPLEDFGLQKRDKRTQLESRKVL